MIFGSTLSITTYPSGIFEHNKKMREKKSIKMRGSKVSTAFDNILFLKKIVNITLKKRRYKKKVERRYNAFLTINCTFLLINQSLLVMGISNAYSTFCTITYNSNKRDRALVI